MYEYKTKDEVILCKLLGFGTTYEELRDGIGQNTVAILQRMDTGEVFEGYPSSLRFVGITQTLVESKIVVEDVVLLRTTIRGTCFSFNIEGYPKENREWLRSTLERIFTDVFNFGYRMGVKNDSYTG